MSIQEGTWDYMREEGHWHFNKSCSSPEFKVIGRFVGDWKEQLEGVNISTNKHIISSMKHRSPDSYFEKIQKGNERDMEKYDFPDDLEYGTVYDEKSQPEGPPEVFARMRDSLPLNDSYIKIHKQKPGEVWPVHFDNYHALRDNIDSSNAWDDPGIRRIMVALKDWNWGHYVLFGNEPWHGWKAGEIVYFDWLVPHGTANCGHSPRYSAFVTGYVTDELMSWVDNNDYKEIEL
jgi:hypothetical protein